MAHWKAFMESEHLGAWDLVDSTGKPIDVTDTIVKVTAGAVGQKKQKKPLIYLEHAPGKKAFVANATNCKTISKILGTANVEEWVGQRITIFATTTEMAGETVDCIRVRPRAPGQAAKQAEKGGQP